MGVSFTDDFNKRSLVPDLTEDDKKGFFKEVISLSLCPLYEVIFINYNSNKISTQLFSNYLQKVEKQINTLQPNLMLACLI